MKIINYKLYNDDDSAVQFINSPNQSVGIAHKYLIMHYTAANSLNGAIQTLTNKAAKASAHLIIDKDGKTVQLVDFNHKAWHAGSSTWKDLVGMNAYSLGIELVNSGPLRQDQSGQFKTWYGEVIPKDQVQMVEFKGKISAWQEYPEAQLMKAIEIGHLLFEEYKLIDVLAHSDIAPNRKQDTGPAFPMDSFRSKMLGRESDTLDTGPITHIEVPKFVYWQQQPSPSPIK